MQYSPVDIYGVSEERTASIFREEEWKCGSHIGREGQIKISA
jgi:hypothetical protein